MSRVEIGTSISHNYNPVDGTKGHIFANGEPHKSHARYFREKVIFKQPFNNNPEVAVGFSKLETDKEYNTRVGVYASNITRDSFEIVYYTWYDTNFYQFRSIWIAVGC